jgi:ABC-type Co2+ transport system permease subunit
MDLFGYIFLYIERVCFLVAKQFIHCGGVVPVCGLHTLVFFFGLVLYAQEAVLCYWFRALFICELVITCLEDGLVASSICFALLHYLVYSLFYKLSWVVL